MNNMVFSNLVMKNVPRPVLMTFNRFRLGVDTPLDTPPMKSMGHMQFNNISVDDSQLDGVPCGIVLSGVPGHYIEDISFHTISFRLPDHKETEQEIMKELPTFVDVRPEFSVLGETMPFAGLYARQVRNLRLVDMRFDTGADDSRPVIMCSDVDGLTLRGIEFGNAFIGAEKIRLINVKEN